MAKTNKKAPVIAMRTPTLAAIAATLCLLASQANADETRYVAPGGAFSISTGDFAERGYKDAIVGGSSEIVVVDFPRLSSTGLAAYWRRTVEWIKLDKPVDPAQFDAQATAAVAGYLELRFGAGTFAVADRGKFRDADGRLVYAFTAKGTLNRNAAVWQGAVLFFDSGAALISEVAAASAMGDAGSKNGIVNQPMVDWAETIRPGP